MTFFEEMVEQDLVMFFEMKKDDADVFATRVTNFSVWYDVREIVMWPLDDEITDRFFDIF